MLNTFNNAISFLSSMMITKHICNRIMYRNYFKNGNNTVC